MPNHVTNKLTVRKGTQKIIPALYSGTIEYNSIDEKLYDILRNFSFNKIIKEKVMTMSGGGTIGEPEQMLMFLIILMSGRIKTRQLI